MQKGAEPHMTMGKRIKLARITAGIKQKELAEKAGISVFYMAALENGRCKNPSIKIMQRLADILQTTPQALFFD